MKKANPALAVEAWVKNHPINCNPNPKTPPPPPPGSGGGFSPYHIGYKRGYADGLSANRESRPIGVWKYDSDGNLYCSYCGMLEPDCLPGACVIWPDEKRYCFMCGTRLLRPDELQ